MPARKRGNSTWIAISKARDNSEISYTQKNILADLLPRVRSTEKDKVIFLRLPRQALDEYAPYFAKATEGRQDRLNNEVDLANSR